MFSYFFKIIIFENFGKNDLNIIFWPKFQFFDQKNAKKFQQKAIPCKIPFLKMYTY